VNFLGTYHLVGPGGFEYVGGPGAGLTGVVTTIDAPEFTYPLPPNIDGSGEPTVMLFTGTVTTDLTVIVPVGTWYVIAYYAGDWHHASPYPSTNPATALFTDAPFGAKAEIPVIITPGDATLPVELSSFTATVNAYHNVQLQWVTQSETNVMGFRIYRGSLEALSTAELLPAFIPATNTSQVQYYLFTDEELSQPGIYYYWLENVDLDGGSNIYGPVSVNFDDPEPGSPEIPIVAGINTIFPNPFNPYTSIRIGVETDARTQINIYNIRGQIVRRLMDKNLQKGTWTITWNGNDDNNNSCSSGLYFMRMTTGKDSYSRKLMLLK